MLLSPLTRDYKSSSSGGQEHHSYLDSHSNNNTTYNKMAVPSIVSVTNASLNPRSPLVSGSRRRTPFLLVHRLSNTRRHRRTARGSLPASITSYSRSKYPKTSSTPNLKAISATNCGLPYTPWQARSLGAGVMTLRGKTLSVMARSCRNSSENRANNDCNLYSCIVQ